MNLWTLMHVNGCGKPAFRRIGKPQPTDPVDAGPCRHLDGSQAQPDDLIICESCGEMLVRLDDLNPDHFVEGLGE